ncbi:hypothetical protein CYY_006103 [Polysphondylium violaceum]|uniref:J domain-containing protein n=1 Tax=Polysphondylium violaceum TaxID=133409 RepID=A0A8J4PR86_9MYCE|nr:hypothetical protein CYY_006103 [Polysphondylium violaceum]
MDQIDQDQEQQQQQQQSQYSEEDIKFILDSTDNGQLNLYSILDIKKSASKEEIESKYAVLCKVYKIDKLSREELQDDNFALQRAMFLAYIILGNEYLREIYDSFDFSNQTTTTKKNQTVPWSIGSVKEALLDLGSLAISVMSIPMTNLTIMIQSSPVVVDEKKMLRYLLKTYSFRNLKELLIIFGAKVGYNVLTIPINRQIFGPYYTFAGLVVNYPFELLSNLMMMNLSLPMKTIAKNLNYKSIWHGLPIYLSYKVIEELLNQCMDGLEIYTHMQHIDKQKTITKYLHKVCSSALFKTLMVSAITCPIHMVLVQYQSTLLYSTNAVPGAILPAALFPASLGIMQFVKSVYKTQTAKKLYNGFLPYVLTKYTPAFNK